MLNVSVRQSVRIIKEAYRLGKSVILMGSPGIGKTSAFKQAVRELAAELERSVGLKIEEGSSLDPTDVRGVLVPNLKEETSFYTYPAIFPKEKIDGEEGILVVDEIGGCMQATQKALQSVFDLRRMGDHKLPAGWIPMGTGNYASDDAGAFPLLSSFSDRMVMLNIAPDFSQWKEDFAIPTGLNQDIVSFLNFRKDLFYTFNGRKKNAKGKGFASPRTYEMASPFLSGKLDNIDLVAAIAGCVGEGVATELIAFIKIKDDLPDITKIYSGTIDVVPEEPSVRYALSGALISYLNDLPEKMTKKTAISRLLTYTQFMPSEFAVLTIKDAMPNHKADIVNSTNWPAWAGKYKDLIL